MTTTAQPRAGLTPPHHAELPPAARAKLIALAGAATDSRDAAASAQRRLGELTAQLANLGHASVDAAGVEHELARLRSIRELQNRRHSELAALVANLNQWLQTLPPGAVLVASAAVTAKTHKDETLASAIARTRDEIAAAQQQLRAVQTAPLPKTDIKGKVRAYVDGLAQRGRPKIASARGSFDVKWRAREATSSGMTPEDVAATLAWFDPAALTARLEAEVDALPEPPLAMSAAEKETRTAELTADLDQLERTEEALIERAHAEGIDVLRRPNASPAAVLGIAIKSRTAAAA